MCSIYNILLNLVGLLIRFLAGQRWLCGGGKLYDSCLGQRDVMEHVKSEITSKTPSDGNPGSSEKNHKTYWFHAASMGEFSILKPVICRLKNERCTVVVTFFSSTGVNAVKPKPGLIDHVFYLPLDTRKNAQEFLDTLRPDVAVFAVSELWYNYLSELQSRRIPTILVSAIVRRNSKYFRWYGGIFRRSVRCFTQIFALNEETKSNLESLGCKRVTLSGDPLFDNAWLNSQGAWSEPVVSRFCQGSRVFIAGSVSDDNDLRLVASLANRHTDVRFLIVPHEISQSKSDKIKAQLTGKTVCCSEAGATLTDVQCLIVDRLGILPYLYRYAKWAYVGGGFTPYLHSVIEATVYGLPVAFGPKVERKVTPQQLMRLGIGRVVSDEEEMERWFEALQDESTLQGVKAKAAEYVAANVGATDMIAECIAKSEAGGCADETDNHESATPETNG